MTSATLAGVRRRPVSPLVVTVLAVAAAFVVGVAMAVNPRIGIVLVLGACAVPLVLLDLAFGIALWAALLALSDLPVLGLAATGAGVLAIACWIGTQRLEAPRVDRVNVIGAAALASLLVWLSLSVAWAQDTGQAASELGRWGLCGLAVVVLLTSLRSRRATRLVLAGFVVGMVVSVLVGIVRDGLGASTTAETLTSTEGRLTGGLGDPNFLAAAIVPAIILAAALVPTVRPAVRWALFAAIGVLVVGLAGTESRGGAVAAVAALVAAFFVMRRERKRILALAVGVALVGAIYFAAYPQGLSHLTSSNGGSGRSELWLVAWRITADHPVTGVGLHNFTVYSPRYVHEPGALHDVDLIAERPHAVHNTFLELLAETGVIGLGLFLVVVAASLAAALEAARRFETRGDRTWGAVARAAFVATVGVLAAAFFVSLESRLELWLVLSLGPVLLVVSADSGRQTAGIPAAEDRRGREKPNWTDTRRTRLQK